PGDSIVLGPGTTTLALARLLVHSPELTVVTNSLLVAQALMEASRVEVILTGGTLRRSIHALVGPAAEESLRALRASQAFISGNGVTAERGLSTPSPVVAAVDRALAAASQQRVVLADNTKLGRETMCQTVPLDRIDALIDVDGARLDLSRQIAEMLVRASGKGWRVTTSTEREELLPGTDYLINSIEVAGLACVEPDYEIPLKYGVDQCIGDTIGPGGIFKALRTGPDWLAIVADTERLAPGAVVMNYTNPMSILTLAAARASS